jgi:hypothetical protein
MIGIQRDRLDFGGFGRAGNLRTPRLAAMISNDPEKDSLMGSEMNVIIKAERRKDMQRNEEKIISVLQVLQT